MYVFTITIALFLFVHDTSHSLVRKNSYNLLLPLFFYSFLYDLFYFIHVLFGGCRTDGMVW